MKVIRAAGYIWAAGLLCVAPAHAQDSPLETLGKAAGLISPPADPPDFVKASRPREAPAAIPVFSPPQEPSSKVKSAAELKAMDADLARASGPAPKRKGPGVAHLRKLRRDEAHNASP